MSIHSSLSTENASSLAQCYLPADIAVFLQPFIETAQTALTDDLLSLTLFGTAASGELRPESDVNVLVVLKRWQRERVDRLRESLRTAAAAIRLAPLFVMISELEEASLAFAEKFSAMHRRRHVLFGEDVIATLTIPRAALIAREKQVLLNLCLRMRNGYLHRSLRPEQAALLLAEAAGPLRGAAATLVELHGRVATKPKVALENWATKGGERWVQALTVMSDARQHKKFAAQASSDALFIIIEVTQALHAAFAALGE